MGSSPFLRATRLAALFLPTLLLGFPASTVNDGDTYEQVIKQKGKPQSEIAAGTTQVLSYADSIIKLRDGIVVSVRAVAPKSSAPPHAVTQQPPSANIAKAKQELDAAVERVVAIINQPVPSMARTAEMNASGWTFDADAIRPDFGSTDIRQTQETYYAQSKYITFEGHPELAWYGDDVEFNRMTKYFYRDRTVPKKKLTEEEMLEVNSLYRKIAKAELRLAQLGYKGIVP
jgi:hypothetical protein